MYSLIYGEIFKLDDLLKIINEIDEKRKELKIKNIGQNKIMTTTFAEDLKSVLKPIDQQL
jgi:hypothetical protein|tara:strand:+ start:966 stop:1145 length:180 start_codon:yes stop_codon:yes gene_type:complete